MHHTVFFSYASADLPEAEGLEAWLQAPPRGYSVWRDRSGIPPGAPEYYTPILDGMRSSANVLLLLSPRWLRSRVSAQELTDARVLGKKIVPVFHPDIARDPATAQGRARKSELFEALAASTVQSLLEPINWIWLRLREGEPVDPTPVAEALATDFDWKRQHVLITQKLSRWQQVQDASALARGAELAALIDAAFSGPPGREPALTDAQRDYLLASQRHDAVERQRIEALHAGAHARSLAYAAQERSEAEPDTALLLASAAARAAAVPEARAALCLLLHRHAALTRVLHDHGRGRAISGLAINPEGDRFASIDRRVALGDEREAQLLIRDLGSGQCISRHTAAGSYTAVAWGARWLAVALPGSIGWLRWDEWKHRFRGNTPTALADGVAPDFLAFSPPTAGFETGELLAWGTRWGDVGVIRVGDHVRLQRRLSEDVSSDALTGLAWLSDGRLLLAEGGRIVVRHVDAMDRAQELAAPGRVFSLSCTEDRWVASCATGDGHGLLFGVGDTVGHFQRVGPPDLAPRVVQAGSGPRADVLLGSTSARAGVGMVTLAASGGASTVLLHGDDAPITALAAGPTGDHLLAGDAVGRVWMWRRSRRSVLVRPATEGPGPVLPDADVSPDVAIEGQAVLGESARVRNAVADPPGRRAYALVERQGVPRWVRWRRDALSQPPETLWVITSGMPLGHMGFIGHERLVFADGPDLVFMPVEDPAAFTRRAGHDNPVKRLLAAGDVVVSLACSAVDNTIDQVRLWAPTGEPLGLVALPENIVALTIEPDASRLLAQGASGRHWIMDLALEAWSTHAVRMAGRDLSDEERRRFHTDAWRAAMEAPDG